jgi:two-component system, chemotaxis family, response regulator Rcp1
MTIPAPSAAIEILLVEDNPGDARLTQEALRDTPGARLRAVNNGFDAMALLRREGQYQGMPQPDLVLLDLNLPEMDGREVLAEIKQDPLLHRIPVVVMSTSNAAQDVLLSYNLHANCYVVKPMDFARFSALVKALVGFWMMVAMLSKPTTDEASQQAANQCVRDLAAALYILGGAKVTFESQ